jgi:hypothetical protein
VSHQKAGNLAHQRCEAPVRRVRPAAMANSLDTGPRYRDASGFPRVQLGGEGRQPQRRPSRWLGVFRPVARREPAEREDDPRALDPRLDGRRKRRIPGELHLLRVTLASSPTAHFVAKGATPPPECPGSVFLPQAAPGHLCVYERPVSSDTGVNAISVCNFNCLNADRFGAMVRGSSTRSGLVLTDGTWAVTAP